MSAELRLALLVVLGTAALPASPARSEDGHRRPALLALASLGPRRVDLPSERIGSVLRDSRALRTLYPSWQMPPKDLTRLPGLLRIAGIFVHDVPVGELGPLRLHFRIILE